MRNNGSNKIIKNIEDTLELLSNEDPTAYQRHNINLSRLLETNAFYTHLQAYVPVYKELVQQLDSNDEGGLADIDKSFADSNKGMGLSGYAIEPIQRAMRYELLLKELLASAEKEGSIDERQINIITSLYETVKEKNIQVNEQTQSTKDIGYQFGDIITGNYHIGDISKRLSNMFFGKSNKGDDEPIMFELISDDDEAADDVPPEAGPSNS